MVKVLITGASGFIGSNLAARLVEQGDDVTCLVRARSNLENLSGLNVGRAKGDVRDLDSIRRAVDGAEVVYHLAGLATAFDSAELMRVNAGGLRNVAIACAERQTPPVLVAVSSLAASGPAPFDRPSVESDPAEPVSNYGRAKRTGELIAQDFADRVPITIVRPPIVFGEGDLQMRNIFRSIFRYGIHVALGVARRRYSLIHVRDLVEALILCAQRGTRLEPPGAGQMPTARGCYFAASDEQPTFAELGRLIAGGLGRPSVRVWRTGGPKTLTAVAAAAEVIARLHGKPYIFNIDKAREARAGDWICSSAAIRNDLDFAPCAPIVDRLRETSDWYRRKNLL